jgi:hypothetical protein
MFRDDTQRAAVCNALLRHFGKPPLFTPERPTAEALRMRDEGCPWSSGERAFFRLAWTLWNDSNQVPFMDVVGNLDKRSCDALGGFIVALGDGSEAIDAWLGEMSHGSLS